MQRLSKFCPPAAALRESIRGNQYQLTRSRADGGGVINKIGRGAHLSRRLLPKVAFLFWGFVLKSAGSSLSAFEKRKKEADSKTGESNFGGK